MDKIELGMYRRRNGDVVEVIDILDQSRMSHGATGIAIVKGPRLSGYGEQYSVWADGDYRGKTESLDNRHDILERIDSIEPVQLSLFD